MNEESLLTSQELKELSQKNQFKAAFYILMDWVVIIGSYLAIDLLENNWFHIITAIIWSGRLHALAVVTHDICHHSMFKNRKVEVFIGNLFCSLPILLSVTRYNYHHNRHHQYLQTDKDPDWTGRNKLEGWITPKPKKEILKILLQDLLGMREKEHMVPFLQWTAFVDFFSNKKTETRCPLTNIDRAAAIIFLGIIATIVYVYSAKPLLVWLGAMTFLKPLMRMRAISLHPPVEMKQNDIKAKLFHTFSIRPNLLERFFFPKNIFLHLEHHLYPSVPYYNLGRLNRILRSKQIFMDYAYQLDGYFMGKNTALTAISKEEHDFYERLGKEAA